MSDKTTIEVAGVLSDIILENKVEDCFYYLKENQYIPLIVKCRMLKVKRYKQILFISYVYVVVKEVEFETFILSLDKKSFFSDILEDGQRLYNRCLRRFKITDIYRISNEGQFRIPNGFNTMLPGINEIITLKF